MRQHLIYIYRPIIIYRSYTINMTYLHACAHPVCNTPRLKAPDLSARRLPGRALGHRVQHDAPRYEPGGLILHTPFAP